MLQASILLALPVAATSLAADSTQVAANAINALGIELLAKTAARNENALMATNDALGRKLAEFEGQLEKHDQGNKSLFDAIRGLMDARRLLSCSWTEGRITRCG